MSNLKVFEFFTTKIFIPICGFFAQLMQEGHWFLLGVIIAAPTALIGIVKTVIKRLRHSPKL